MTVNELARHAGVTPHAVRYYARIGLLKPTRSKRNGYQQFGEADIKRVRFIRRSQSHTLAASSTKEGMNVDELFALAIKVEETAP